MLKWIIAGAVLLIINDAIVWAFQHRRRQSELEAVSQILGEMLNRKKYREGTPAEEWKSGQNDAQKKKCTVNPESAKAKWENFPAEFSDTELSKIRYQFARLKEMYEGIEQQSQKDYDEIRKLIAEIAHQMRNPLANVQTYLELLEDTSLEDEQREYLNAVADSGKKLQFLTESFLKMARLEGRIIQIRKNSDDIQGTLSAAADRIRTRAKEKDIEFRIWHSEGAKTELPHDENWLGEAIYNLLDNAVKYSQMGSVIEICTDKNELSYRIGIRDYGIGIAKEEVNEIFKRFYRGKNVTNQEGFGLGLYLTREIVSRHGGLVRVKMMNPGSMFEIVLPAGAK
ncbi:HAMP domain-containing sensor histidine kinase [Roseburia hominis]